jgi:ribonuclease HI
MIDTMPQVVANMYYAVAIGRQPGIYRSWADTKKQVDGFKNPKYRKFATEEEAKDFIASVSSQKRVPSVVAQMGVDVGSATPCEPDDLVVFTDGSAIGNGKAHVKAGFAMVWPNHPHLTASHPLVGGIKTNNRAEYTAAIQAIEVADTVNPTLDKPLYIYTDSMLLINSVTKWMSGWKRKGWKKADGEEVMNKDLVMRLDELVQRRRVIWKHVAAHTGGTDWESTWNAKADELAKAAAS